MHRAFKQQFTINVYQPCVFSIKRKRFFMFGSLFDIAKDVVDIATAPVEVAVDVTRAVTKPIAETAQEIVKDIKDELE
jgi:hypothetical protein|tara:strand:+ start:5849 stop:6082 length:234 start_codon:yes stop_codon:yes gene_type:complete